MNSDFRDLLRVFAEHEVQCLVVGGYAVIHHTQPRFTKDLDVWVAPSVENARRFAQALHAFGAPMIDVTIEDFAATGTQYVIGVPPNQIDFLTSLPGQDFAAAWENRVVSDDEGFAISYIGRDDLIKAKKSAGRPQDLADLEELRRAAL